jgi:hypothetical protein
MSNSRLSAFCVALIGRDLARACRDARRPMRPCRPSRDTASSTKPSRRSGRPQRLPRISRSGPTGRLSAAGSTCHRARPSTSPIDRWDSPRRARARGRIQRGGAHRDDASSSGCPTAPGASRATLWKPKERKPRSRPPRACRDAAFPRARLPRVPRRRAGPLLGYSAVQLEGDVARARRASARRWATCTATAATATTPARSRPRASSRAKRGARRARAAEVDASSVAAQRREILRRVRSANPYVRMPPLGVTVADTDGLASRSTHGSTSNSTHQEKSP